MSNEAVTDRIAFRVECFVVDGVSQVSFSGFFDPKATLEDKDLIVDELMAVAERQRAKVMINQLQAERDAKQLVVDSEQSRYSLILKDAEAQQANGGMQDATGNAMKASQQNIERRKDEVLLIDAKLAALKVVLREPAQPDGS